MFFIRVGAAIAWVLVLLGIVRVATSFTLSFAPDTLAFPDLVAGYLETSTAAEALEQGIMYFVAGIVLGLLAQIAKGVKFE